MFSGGLFDPVVLAIGKETGQYLYDTYTKPESLTSVFVQNNQFILLFFGGRLPGCNGFTCTLLALYVIE